MFGRFDTEEGLSRRWLLILLVCLFLVGSGALRFYIEWRKEKPAMVSARIKAVDPQGGLSLEGLRYVKNSGGKPVWILEAEKARKRGGTDRTVTAQGVRVVIYETGRPAYLLEARHGEAKVKEGLFRVWDQVTVQALEDDSVPSDRRMRADELFYDEGRGLVYSDRPVVFEAPDLKATGQRMQYFLEEGRLILSGGVSTVIDEGEARPAPNGKISKPPAAESLDERPSRP